MKFKSVLITSLSLLFAITACGGNNPGLDSQDSHISEASETPSSEVVSSEAGETPIEVHEREVQRIDDNYRNYYQIFVYSFADSNGDGIGDLQGIIDKLDYLEALNITGLWLTPIHPSNNYHHYDVIDYYAVAPEFGTLNTYRDLVNECHRRGMKIILDLVINHSSPDCNWLEKCVNAHINNDPSNQYYNYYLVNNEGHGKQYRNSGWYYDEGYFSGMAELNIASVVDGSNSYLTNEIKNLIKFWIDDYDVDGFRIDAAKHFCDLEADNITFLNFLNQETKAIKSDAYLIGEVLDAISYTSYYKSDIDSFFAFRQSKMGGTNYLGSALFTQNINKAKQVYEMIVSDTVRNPNAIPAPVLANHDNGLGRTPNSDLARNKLLKGIFTTLNGCTFDYYGEEIGMVESNRGLYEDMSYRQPIDWGDRYTCTPVPGSGGGEQFIFGNVAEQLNNENSILKYHQKAYRYRLENPELARGVIETIHTSDNKSLGVFKKTYNGSAVYIILNISQSNTCTYDCSGLGTTNVVGDLSADESPVWLANNVISMPPRSMIILH